MIAGGAMSAIGTLTGNKKLSQFGAVLGLAGGVAGLASGAWASAADGIATEAAKEGAIAFEHGAGAVTEAGSASGGMLQSAGALGQANAGAIAGGATPMASAAATGGAPMFTAPAATAPAIPVNGPAGVAAGGGTAPSMLSSIGDKLSGAVDWAKQGNNARLVQAGSGILSAGLGAYGQQEAAKEQIKAQEDAQARARQRLNDSITPLRVPTYRKP